MAKPKPTNSVAVEKLRIIEGERTKQLIACLIAGVVALAIIAWAVVRITDKPPWLTLALAALALVGTPSAWLVLNLRRVVKLYADFRDYKQELEQEKDATSETPKIEESP